ncbi:MAG: A24 family peptidase [Halieaceae bacterium]|jgi:leader peptidase (prepilin peptidase)/N-methyltransferase|nr:A24 family peptidase [Halieaceae bacterium]
MLNDVGALLAAEPLFLGIVLALLGLTVGSFLNVVILRLPAMLQRGWTRDCRALLEIEAPADGPAQERFSLAFPASHCPECKSALRPWHNVPVISYLFLRGRCAFCASPIGLRYPAVETLTAALSVLVGLAVPWSLSLLAFLLLTWSLIALAVIDIDTQLLPDDITLPLLWGGLAFNLATGTVPIADAVLGAMAGYLLLWSIYWLFRLVTGKEGMGYGDFKLLAALGAWMGWQSLGLIILMSSAVGAVLGILILSLRGQSRSQPLPFGPYLAAAGWIVLLWGDELRRLLGFGAVGLL